LVFLSVYKSNPYLSPMKFTILLLISISYSQLFGQYYIRTKKNLGVVGMYNVGSSNQLNPSYQFALCKQFGRYAVPEIGIKAQSHVNGLEINALYAGIQFRKNLVKLNERKKGAKCKLEMLEGFVTPEFNYYLAQSASSEQAPFSIRYGLGLYHVESGGSKRSRSWATKMEVYHRSYLDPTIPYRQEFGVALRIQHFKTYDFLK
jgi:hypothetical protein